MDLMRKKYLKALIKHCTMFLKNSKDSFFGEILEK
jgi:hypothetical protein